MVKGEEERLRGEEGFPVAIIVRNSFGDAAPRSEIALYLNYIPFAQFPACTTAHLGSGSSIPLLLDGRPREIMANPLSPAPNQTAPKDLALCLRFPMNQPLSLWWLAITQPRQTHSALPSTRLIARRETRNAVIEVMSAEGGLLGSCVLRDDYFSPGQRKVFHL